MKIIIDSCITTATQIISSTEEKLLPQYRSVKQTEILATDISKHLTEHSLVMKGFIEDEIKKQIKRTSFVKKIKYLFGAQLM